MDALNKKIIVGITGSIAAYKALVLVRQLKKQGCDVWVVMTENAKRFVTPLSFETLSNNPVFSCMFYEKEISSESDFNKSSPYRTPVHIDLTRDASAIIVAPATANIIAKAAAGIADDLLSTIILSATQPVVFVPAMNHRMWCSNITQKNIGYLKSLGFKFVEPETGELACAEFGKGRFPSIDVILREIRAMFDNREILKGKKVVITAGRTEESFDPIRVFTNRSSGRMGVEIAKAAKNAGADVILIGGNLSVSVPTIIETKLVHSTKEMFDAVNLEVKDADILIMAAAVSDYKPAKSYNEKQKAKELTLKLIRTPDILKTIAQKNHKAYVVGFSLDTDNNLNEGQRKLKEKKLNLIVANPVGTLNSDEIKPTLIYNRPASTRRRRGETQGVKIEKLAMQSKSVFAEKLIDVISRELKL